MGKHKTRKIKGSGPKLPVLGEPKELLPPRPPKQEKEAVKNFAVPVVKRRSRSRSRSTSKSRSSSPKTPNTPSPKFKPRSPDEPMPEDRYIRNTTKKALKQNQEEKIRRIQANAEKNMSRRTRKLRANIDAAAAAIGNIESDEELRQEQRERNVNYISKADADKIKLQIDEIQRTEEEQAKEDADIVNEIMVDRVDSLKDYPEKQIIVIKIGKKIEKQLEQLRKIVTEISILDSNRKYKMKYLNSMEEGIVLGNQKAFTILENAISQIEEKIIDAEKIKEDLILRIEEEHNKLADI